ncbi:MAG: acetyltransferase with multiple hexapeptide repeat domain [Chitinophagaceae bacterium]|nr:acetyltransferase with multiple hexapeptide repeat domain [Chitinophagaceae bacterium]
MLLYGASGHAKVVRDCILASGKTVNALFDDNTDLIKLDDTPVVGIYRADYEAGAPVIVTVGDNLVRKKLVSRVKHAFGTAIHPSAVVSKYAKVGEGSVIMPGSIINSASRIGKHCIVNSAAIVEYECLLEDFVHVSPNVTLCAGSSIGEGSHIGAGATIIPNKKIGKWCVIGAGSVITQDVPDYSMVVGVPGKIIKALVKKV